MIFPRWIVAIDAPKNRKQGEDYALENLNHPQYPHGSDVIQRHGAASQTSRGGERAYLEVSVILTSKHAYVAVVTTELGGLPEEVVNKLKHADSPDAESEKVQFDLPVPEVEVEPGEVELRVVGPSDKEE